MTSGPTRGQPTTFRGRIVATPYERALHVVVYPTCEDDLLRLLEFAEARRVALIPPGGESSVVGGIEPDVPPNYAGVLSVELREMRAVREIDQLSRRARVQAGILGPDLEEALRREGLAFRHCPQSYTCSTVGGWIATRAGGRSATLCGKIETAVESMRVVTPRGRVETRKVPQSASGPGGKAWFVGSEGALGS
ncbi:FAD-binding oxidoreductase [Limnochorda pilosa]|uniref:FAD-linked oxidase n=1 Tax=Limnochorda pilosa TaxID=1555112 RepID=A0A0K2SH06_LIMPI|nr:FAD-binding oxidoreductase [Limnochorda pilosa]BAS26312.1 FAD-linked oxidase [Limnochorda pilosa]